MKSQILKCLKIFLVTCVFLLGYNTLFSQRNTNAQPNILWIVAEDLSPHLGSYGERVAKTPNLDQLAKESIRFTNAFTTAGVCAPSRSAIITGMYQVSIGTHHMRTTTADVPNVTPYSAMLPAGVKCFPEYLRSNGYYCTNNVKQDYQFEASVATWDENSVSASWRNRPSGKPFFSVFNLFKTHESQLFPSEDPLTVNPASALVPPIYPETELVRKDIARFLTNMEIVDTYVGEIISRLKADGLYEKTIIFFFGDHGDGLPWMKRELYDRGIHIPLIVKLLNQENANSVNEDLVSAVDFGPTVLSLGGVPIPKYMEGQAFLGNQKAKMPRQYIYAARDRMDSEYDRVRIVRSKKFKYVYNYMPEKTNYQNVQYRLAIPMMSDILKLRDEGKLNAVQQRWFETKPVEELYDLDKDPGELNNVVDEVVYSKDLNEMRKVFKNWTDQTKDMGGIPESEMLKIWWGGKDAAPTVGEIQVAKKKDGVRIYCSTEGVSFAYRILNRENKAYHEIMTWDFARLRPEIKNGEERLANHPWTIYDGIIPVQHGDTLSVQGYRPGYKVSTLQYVVN